MTMNEQLINLSEEQQNFIDVALSGKNILVDACIGSGKTTAIQHLCKAFPYKTKILYLTYSWTQKLKSICGILRSITIMVLLIGC